MTIERGFCLSKDKPAKPKPIIRAFCRGKDQEAALIEYGVEPKSVWREGRGAETFARCLATYRGRPGILIVAHDLRVLEDKKRQLTIKCEQLEKSHIQIIDISHPEDTTISALLLRAHLKIDGTRYPDRRIARRRGRQGGLAKGQQAIAARSGIDTDWLIGRLVNDPDITWPVKLRVLGGKISESTLRRRYLIGNGERAANDR